MAPWILHRWSEWSTPLLGMGPTPQAVLLRGVGAFVIAFMVVFLAGRRGAAWLYRKKVRDRVRDFDAFYGKNKTGTPTMGGLFVVAAIVAASLLMNDLGQRSVPLLILATLWFGAVGAVDDLLKVRDRAGGGLSRSLKMLLQVAFACFLALILSLDGTSPFPEAWRHVVFLPAPAIMPAQWNLGWVYPLFVVFVIVSIANAINFADGLDGLAVLPSAFVAAVFGFFAYMAWNSAMAKTFGFVPLPGIQEVAIYCSAVAGACIGFLWFNGYPAQMIMGDTGSQALGGTLGVVAVLTKQEMLFLLAGAIFVYEAFSVFWQDSVGIRHLGRRFFFRAPAHHSFQHQGVAETKVVLRFWIVSLLTAILSIATLKLR